MEMLYLFLEQMQSWAAKRGLDTAEGFCGPPTASGSSPPAATWMAGRTPSGTDAFILAVGPGGGDAAPVSLGATPGSSSTPAASPGQTPRPYTAQLCHMSR